MSVLVRDDFCCQECGRIEANTTNLVAHHKDPHRGNEQLFWDVTNLAGVCKPCHDGPIKARERRLDQL